MTNSRMGGWLKSLSVVLAAAVIAVACKQTDITREEATTVKQDKATAALFETAFEEPQLPAGWERTGDVSLDPNGAFEGRQSLRLTRAERDMARPVSVVGPWFPIAQGDYDVQVAMKTELVSPDNSFKGTVDLELLDEHGKVSNGPMVAEQDGKRNWVQARKQVGVPASYVKGRVRIQIDKASGKFWVDALSIRPAVLSGDPVINRVFFDTAQVGNLLYPTDSRVVKVTAWALRPLNEKEQKLSCVVRDYWGAEQALPLIAEMKATGRERNFIVYQGRIDMAGVPLEVGRYYEIHGTVTKSDGSPFSNWTSFAILPEAAANSYPPEQVPFTARTWDARIPVAQPLTHRLGIRIAGVWGIWSTNPPYEASIHAPVVAEVERLKMGLLTGSPAHAVEQRKEGDYEKYTGEVLRGNIRSFIKKYGHIKPMVINLGNEPHNKGEDVKLNVEAYKAIYQEIKRIDPSVIVLGTSVGPSEDFFKYGFGEWCDAYDFHIYGDVKEIRAAIEQDYPKMFAKYGQKKPIWSTELGSNSHGLARLTVAADVVRKFSNFFAAGGEKCCWFGIMYPDPDATITGSSGEAHNLFDCRYNKYHPKLDAISLYNMVNGIGAKKFVAEKDYDGTLAFLFRDKDNQTLQVLYRNKGRVDAFVPLVGVGEVQLIRIDGTRSTLDAKGGGLSLTINEDPILLLYKGGEAKLPTMLETSFASIQQPAGSVVVGQTAKIRIQMSTLVGHNSTLTVPPQWKVSRQNWMVADPPPGGRSGIWTDDFTVTCPAGTTAREAQMIFQMRDAAGKVVGELRDRPTVTGAITMSALPVPARGGNPAGVRLAIRNNGKDAQTIPWEVALIGEKPCLEGKYDEKLLPSKAYFAGDSSGQVQLRGGEARDVYVPMAQVEPHSVYHVKAIVKDASGRQIVDERPMGGFVGVPKVARGAIKIDGEMETVWKKAPVQVIDNIEQFYWFQKTDRRLAWTGPEDLSAEIRYLWDDDNLYVLVTVKDDIAGAMKADNYIWYQDGLQFLIDPTRTSKQKVGKYDYGIAKGSKGIQAWAFMSADPGVTPGGEVRDMKIAIKNTKAGTGNTTYEIAFPWARLSPFRPVVNGNLGFTLIVNEDDGKGRDSFMTWFGNAHTKDVDTVGDLILLGD